VDSGVIVSKKQKVNARRSDKFFLGFDVVIRELQQAERKLKKSIAVGQQRVAQSAKASAPVQLANKQSLAGSRNAQRIVSVVLKQLAGAPCLDQFMNCDPEYFLESKMLRGTK
jgi:hypothetical protein